MSKTTILQSGKNLFLILFIVLFSIQVFAVDNFAGNCLEFDGVDDFVEFGSAGNGSLSVTSELTFAVWIKVPTDFPNTERIGVIFGNYDNNPNFNLEGHTNGRLRIYWNNGELDIFTTDVDVRDNNWHHIAVTRDSAADEIKLYYDGVLKITSTAGSNIDVQWPFRAGNDFRTVTGIPFTGQMDEISLWNIARTQPQIQDGLYNTLEGTEPGLINYWQLNESSGTTASDAVGSIDGTLINMTDDDWITSTAPIIEGSGTSGDPYQISNLAELYWLSTHSNTWNKHFIQTADIDAFATSTWNGGEGFVPIGNNTTRFTGTYNGQGYTIDGLYINRPSSYYYQSLFGKCDGATIENLGVTNVDVTGGDYYTGGLVGNNVTSSTISNCYSTGSVSGGLYTGGLVGFSYGSTISNCYSSCSMNGDNYTGGLVGYDHSSTISNCYGTGSVSGDNYIGGLVGHSEAYSTISNCYSTGSVSGAAHTGGLVGYNDYSTINNSFWDTETSGQATSAGGTGKTTAEMQTESTFTDAGWDFVGETANGSNDYWGMISGWNNDYPILVVFATFTASPLEVFIGTEIQFTDNSFASTEWQWDFENDGTYDSTEQNPVYTYPTTGVYSVTLTVSDGTNTNSYTRNDYIFVNSEPAAPQNVQVTIVGDDAIISWDAVTHDIDGVPINLDGYIVLHSENNIDFFYLQYTIELSHTHTYVAIHNQQMFYQVFAYKSYSTRQLEYLKELNNSREKLKWSEVKRNLERIKDSPQRR